MVRRITLLVLAGIALGGCGLFEPRVPKNLKAEVAGSELVVTWSAVLGADHYDLCRRIEGGFGTNGECIGVPDAANLPRTRFSYAEVPAKGSTYFFRVRARNSSGVSPWSVDSPPVEGK